jgi:hypothetical protein
MSPKTGKMLLRLALVPVATAVLAVAGCTSSMNSATQTSGSSGPAFMVGTDAPLAAGKPNDRQPGLPDQQLHDWRIR